MPLKYSIYAYQLPAFKSHIVIRRLSNNFSGLYRSLSWTWP